MITWKMARKRGWTGHLLHKKSGKGILVSGTRGCKGRWHGQESVSVRLQSQLPASGDRDARDLSWAVRRWIGTLKGLTLHQPPWWKRAGGTEV